ncbi:HAD-IA family hydrolase [Kitasatospora brasiliensis]|uniref:HAD-IA family hydrolase n=1 Tax=Kitasatospora brasiliensis TaxID=3058040 RepID=UPI00292FE243|nr:HAD-IA family hydrolase [Kitasatospora sp. K002]
MTTPLAVTARALLFDMDGTLVDSAASIDRVWREFAARHGLAPETVLAALPGRTARDIVAGCLPEADGDTVAAEVARIREREEAATDAVAEIPGARRLLTSLPADAWAVVTSASRTMTERRLAAAGLPLPEVAVCAGDVQAGKPDPEGFRTAARLLGVDIADCLLFEDSAPGLLAARRSGGTAVAVAAPAEEAAPYRVDDLTAVSAHPGDGRIRVEIQPSRTHAEPAEEIRR